MELTEWLADWQHRQHAVSFDFRAAMPDGTLIREYDSFNDVGLLNERIRGGASSVVEIGCATGEFYRYMNRINPSVEYWGVDVSEPALERARSKYPKGRFQRVTAQTNMLGETAPRPTPPDIVYSKDVMHHQAKPFEFLSELLRIPKDSMILRCRTRDNGATEWDPEKSCQYHYDGWMPYIVINTQELVDFIKAIVPDAEIVVMRHRMILGGVHARFIPKDCYLPQTGTAETSIGVFLKTNSPRTVRFNDRADTNPKYTLSDRMWFGKARAMTMLRGKQSS